MGLGKLLLKVAGGGSYGIIARNIAYIYSSLSTSYARRFPTPLELYVTAGTIDTLDYLRKCQITPWQIAASLKYAFAGQCSLSDCPVRHASPMAPTCMPEALVSFAMQMQCLIYRADKSHLPLQAILTEVLEAKPIIAEHVIATLRRCNDPSYRRPMWDTTIASFMHAESFAEFRSIIGIRPDGAVGATAEVGGAGDCHSVPQEDAHSGAESSLEPQAATPQFKSKHGPTKQMMAPGYPIPIPMVRAYLHRALRDFSEELSLRLKEVGHAPVAAVMKHLILHSWSYIPHFSGPISGHHKKLVASYL